MSASAPAARAKSPPLGRTRSSLGTRLTLTLLPLILVPMLALGGAAYVRARGLIRDQVVGQLERNAGAQVDSFVQWRLDHNVPLFSEAQRALLSQQVATLAEVGDSPTRARLARAPVAQALAEVNGELPDTLFTGLMVVRLSDGKILAATSSWWEGETVSLDALTPTAASHITRDISFSRATPISILTIMPFVSDTGAPVAALVGVTNDATITTLVQQAGIASSAESEVYLVIPPDTIVRFVFISFQVTVIRDPAHPVFAALARSESGDLELDGFDGEPMLGVYQWMPDLQAGLVVQMPQRVAFAGLNSLSGFSLALVAGSMLLVFLVVPWATSRSLRPLGKLSDFADRLALGEWGHRVEVGAQDEVGRLGNTFNRMAEELGGLYHSLEERVAERTQEIRTAAEVARDSAAIRDVDRLLDETVRLISARFGFYHAGIFLIDPAGENAVLRAASSEGGRKMLARGHSLGVGKLGIVGYVTGTGNPRIALDVGSDAVHFANPDLPETRSEMALPLRIGERIMGALDVQSTEPNAFDDHDILALQTMADQVAVAIENASLIETETHRAAQRRRIIDISRQLTQELGFAQVVAQAPGVVRESFGYERVTLALVEGGDLVVRSSDAAPHLRAPDVGKIIPRGLGPLGRSVSLKAPTLIVDLAAEPQTPTPPAPDEPQTMMAVPLLSRNRVIGALAVEGREAGSLSEDDAELLETLAGLLAVALENARLFEETQQSLAQVDALYRQQTEEAWRQLLASKMSGSVKTQFEFSQKPGDRTPRPEDARLQAAIRLRGEVLGSLDLEGPKSARQFGEDDQEILNAVAEEVGFALEQARLMEEIHRRATQLRTASEIARDVTSILEIDTLLGRVTTLLHDRFGFHFVAAYLSDETGKRFVLREATGEAGAALKARETSVRVGDASILGEVAKTGETYLAHDTSHDPRFDPIDLLPDTQTELVLPLKTGDRVIGMLDIQHTRANTFTEDDLAVLQILADQLGVAVQNTRSYAEAMQRARHEEAILDLTSRLRATHDIDDILETAVAEIRKTLGAKQAVIRLAANLDQPEPGDDGAAPMARPERGNGHPPDGKDGSA
jgi:GAF domain-containing protein/HAMP domain-containing protein